MVYKIKSEDEMYELLKELAHVMTNMRHAQKEWSVDFGFNNRNKKIYWEKRADDLIERLNLMPKHPWANQIENKKDP